MATLLNPIFAQEKLVLTVSHRFYSMFKPIQATDDKESDFISYLAVSMVDYALSACFLLNAAIEVINASVKIMQALISWVLNQQHETSYVDEMTIGLLQEATVHFFNALLSGFAAKVLMWISLVSLLTRAAASIVELTAPTSVEHKH